LAAQIAVGQAPPSLLLLEHPHTYTFGRRGKASNLLWDEATLRRRGVEVHWIDRGGDVTYHGPGQLVGYPLLPLGRVEASGHLPQADYVGYLRRLEEVLIRALASLGLASAQLAGATGVWVQPDVASRCPHCPPAARQRPSKIASIGVRVDARGVSRHGFALNLHPDMSYWEGIIACDLPDHPQICVADLLEPVPTLEQACDAVIQAFGRVFSFRMLEVPHAQGLLA
jgi:lipoate-protein ligase B